MIKNLPTSKIALTFLAVFCVIVIPDLSVAANSVPGPSMDFRIEYEIHPESINEAKLLSCDDIQCLGKREFMGYFNCWNSSRCGSYVLPNTGSYSEYQKLVISFEDKQRESNVFTRKEFRATYLVTVRGDDLQVKEILVHTIFDYLVAIAVFIFNLLVEVPIANLVFSLFQYSKEHYLDHCGQYSLFVHVCFSCRNVVTAYRYEIGFQFLYSYFRTVCALA